MTVVIVEHSDGINFTLNPFDYPNRATMTVTHCDPTTVKFDYPLLSGSSELDAYNQIHVAQKMHLYQQLWPEMKSELLRRGYTIFVLGTAEHWHQKPESLIWETDGFKGSRIREKRVWGERFKYIALDE